MNLLRTAIKSNRLIRIGNANQGLPMILRDSPRLFSTEAERPTQEPPANPFIRTSTTGLVYGKLYGITNYTTKSDILNVLEGCNLSLDDVKVDYNKFYAPIAMFHCLESPLAATTKREREREEEEEEEEEEATEGQEKKKMKQQQPPDFDADAAADEEEKEDATDGALARMVQFPSKATYDAAIRAINRKGCLYRLERAYRNHWDLIAPFNGKAVLLQGIPRNALPEDVERFLSGCKYDASSLQMFVRPTFPDLVRVAIVRFASSCEAMHAFITKNRGFCLNNQILVRVLQ